MARKLALVPEEGASLPIYVLSYLQNMLLVKAVSPIPKRELDDEPIDVAALDTYDILQRARYVYPFFIFIFLLETADHVHRDVRLELNAADLEREVG